MSHGSFFTIIHDYYPETVQTAVKIGAVVSYQSFGDLMRWNPHFHCIVLEGGIQEAGAFHHIPIKDTAKLTEVFRRRVIKLFVDRGLLCRYSAACRFALKILSWQHSGFSVDNPVSIPASSRKARVNLSQYIIRHPAVLLYGLHFTEDPLRTIQRDDYLHDTQASHTLLWAIFQQDEG